MSDTQADLTQQAARPIDPAKTHQVSDFEHDKALTCCKIDPSGRFVFAGAEDRNVYRWEVATGIKTTLTGHESWVRSMDFSTDGQWLYTAGWDGQLRYWSVNAAQPESLHTVQAHQGFARWVHTSPCGRMLTTSGNDNFVRVWDEATGQQMIELSGHERHPYAVCFHPTDGMLVSHDLMGNVFVWDPRKHRHTETIKTTMTGYDKVFAADMGGARDMHFNADGSLLASAGIRNIVNTFAGQQDPVVGVIDWDAKKVTHYLQAAEKKPGIMWGVRFHPDGFIIGAVAQQNVKGELLFWRLSDTAEASKDKAKSEDADKPVELKSFHAMPLAKCARGMDFTPDLRSVAVAHSDGHVRIYEMAEKIEVKKNDQTA